MSSSTLDTIADYLSHIQQRRIFTRERFLLIRVYFFQSIGLFICLSQFSILSYRILTFLFWLLFQIFSIIFWIPLKTIELFIPKTTNYNIIIPLLWFCSVISFSIAKYSHRNIGKRHSFLFIFILLLLLQFLFILLPIATSIQEQRKLSSTSLRVEQTPMKFDKIREVMGKDLKVESDVEDEQTDNLSNLEVSSIEEQELFIQQQANHLVDSPREFSSKLLENLSKYLKKKIEQIKAIEQRKSIFEKQFSSSKNDSSSNSFSSIYTAFTDLNCYDYTKFIYRDKQKYIHFLHTYRYRSPFPIYLSIIKSNGPICNLHSSSSSSCAIRSKLKSKLFRFIRFWMIIGVPMIICIVIYNRLRFRQRVDTCKQLSNEEKIPKFSNLQPLDKELENKLRLWLDQQQSHGYESIKEACRMAFNRMYSQQYEQLNIETLHFSNANLRNVSQTSIETIVITALLDMDHLIFNVIKDEHFLIKIAKLTGEIEIRLIENNIEVKFKQIQMDSAEIIDTKNILSSDEKESLLKLLKDVIHQTTVQCSFHLSDNQEKTAQPTILPIVSQPSIIDQPHETPIIAPVDTNHQHILPEREVKKLLIRIVKAVQLHDVEQPYCILELNHPKQIHQTSLAKNGLNPFWDERFLFECNDKSNQIRLQIIDCRKANKKLQTNPSLIETVYADVSIPFSYVTSTIYKQDVRITPQYPESIIRIEFSTLTEEEALVANHGYDIESITNSPNWSNAGRENRQTPSDEILTLACHADGSLKGYTFGNNIDNHLSSPQSHRLTAHGSLTTPDNVTRPNKPRKSRSFMNSFRFFSRRKKHKQNENGFTPIQSNMIPHSFSAEPVVNSNPPALSRHHSVSQSFRNFFKRKPLNTNNFILDHPDLISVSTPTPKKRTFFRRFRSKKKPSIHFSTNSLTSEDRTRSESVRNTPIRANVGRPVTMT